MRRVLVLIATTLVVAAPAAVRAVAQEETTGPEAPGSEAVTATGEIERPEITTYQYGTHAVTDEASGARYALRSGAVDLDEYVGRRATVSGVTVPGYEGGAVEGGPPLLEVSRVEPSGSEGSGGPADPTDPADPELGVDLDGDGERNEADGDLATRISRDAAASAAADAAETGQRTLPATGGPVLLVPGDPR